MAQAHSQAFHAGQRDLLERIARGGALGDLLEAIVRFIEEQAEGMLCSILLVDHERGCVRAGAAPSLPEVYTRALDGAAIGPNEGSCGAAAARAERVVVEDIATHPNWVKYKALALPHGLRASWSSPILSPEGKVLGTFAMYYRETRGPTDLEMSWVDVATHIAAIAIVRDAVEQSLRRSEERTRAVIEHTPNVCIQWYDRQGRMLFANRVSRALFGWTDAEAIGKTLDQLNFTVAETARFMGAIEEVATTGAPKGPLEFEFAHPDGSPGTLLSTVFRIPTHDNEHCYVCMDVDLTAYKRAQERIAVAEKRRAFVYDHVNDVIFYLTIEPNDVFRFASVNTAFCTATGLAEGDVVGKTVDQVIPEPSRTLVLAKYHEAMASKKPVAWDEMTPYPSGLRYGEVTVAPILDDEGRCTSLVGTVHDMTARKAAEQARHELETKFHHAHRLQSLGTLAGGIAHDFNNILMAMRGNIELALRHAAPGTPVRANLDELDSAGARAAELVRQILDFSRQQAPKRQLVTPAAVVDEAVRLLRVTLPRTLELRTKYASDTPRIEADATQLHQVVMNLATNAAHATPKHTGTVDIELDGVTVDAQTAPPGVGAGRYARLRVVDHGIGMTTETLARIFEPFFTTKTEQEGTGLGLSVVQGVVKNHGGAIAVESALGRGTTFTLYFPSA